MRTTQYIAIIIGVLALAIGLTLLRAPLVTAPTAPEEDPIETDVSTSCEQMCKTNPDDRPECACGIPVSYTNASEDMIRVDSPQPRTTIQSPLTVTGTARGPWYFEATAPVVVTDWNGLIIGEGYITAEGEWMTEDHVPFSGTITFTQPTYGERGLLIMQASNASGLPEHDRALEIPIFFNQPAE